MAIEKKESIDGYVAFLDILGFSELVSRTTFEEDFDFSRYSEIIGKAVQTDSSSLQYAIFSDSIVVSTDSGSRKQLQQIVEAVG